MHVLSTGLALLTLSLLVLGPLLAQLRLAGPMIAGLLFALGGVVGLFALGAGLFTVFARHHASGWLAVVIGGSAVLILVLGTAIPATSSARLNDVATDLEDPPPFSHLETTRAKAKVDLSYPPAFIPLVKKHYPDVLPLDTAASPERAFETALEVARGNRGWSVTHVDSVERTFEVIAETGIFRFQDDVVVRVRARAGGSRIDVRSKSRLGKGDLGANAKRIRAFIGEVAAKLR